MAPVATIPSTTRIVSVDALRGFVLFWLIGGHAIFVNLAKAMDDAFPRWLYLQLEHVPWVGFTFWDLIQPLFLFIVGIVMPFSFSKRLGAGERKLSLYLHMLKRVAILWTLGMAIGGNLLTYDLSQLHLYSNTLQRIAAGYLISTIIILNLNVLGQIVATLGLLTAYWLVVMFVPVSGHGAGVFHPTVNICYQLDQVILGRFWAGTTWTYVVPTLTSAANVMLGVLAGELLRLDTTPHRRLGWLFGWGIILLLAGLLCSHWMPIIKRMYTTSYTLYAGGWCFLVTALFYLIIDILRVRKWSFMLVVIGANAIVAYVATQLFSFALVSRIFLHGLKDDTGRWYPFLESLGAFAVVWLILFWMYRKKTLVRI